MDLPKYRRFQTLELFSNYIPIHVLVNPTLVIRNLNFTGILSNRWRSVRARNLQGEGSGGGELLANEIAGGDVRDAEKMREASGVSALSDAGAP